MNEALHYFIEANLYLLVFYLLYQIILAKHKHFRFNRAFLLGGIFLSLTLPLVTVRFGNDPGFSQTLEGYIVLPAVTIASAQNEGVGFIGEWWHIFTFIYLAGFAFYLIRLLYQLLQITKPLLMHSDEKEAKGGYTLIKTNGEIPTCSFFRYLFWDQSVNLNKKEEKQIMEHELVHIRQLHSFDILIIGLLRAVFWFNPIIHLIKENITEVHEYLADHYATREIDVNDYSRLLTLQVFKSYDFAISNNFHKSQVVKRIRMLKSDRSRALWINLVLLVPVLTLLITVLSYDVSGRQSEDIEGLGLTNEALSQEGISGEIFTEAEKAPAPEDGMKAFYYYIQQNLLYPSSAREQGIEGKVFVEFVVDSQGTIRNVKAVKGIGGGCDAEAVRVIQESAPWKPGTEQGRPVNVKMIMPITFKLG